MNEACAYSGALGRYEYRTERFMQLLRAVQYAQSAASCAVKQHGEKGVAFQGFHDVRKG